MNKIGKKLTVVIVAISIVSMAYQPLVAIAQNTSNEIPSEFIGDAKDFQFLKDKYLERFKDDMNQYGEITEQNKLDALRDLGYTGTNEESDRVAHATYIDLLGRAVRETTTGQENLQKIEDAAEAARRAEAEEKAAKAAAKEETGCDFWNIGCHLMKWVGKALNIIGYAVHLIAGALLAMASALINILIKASTTITDNDFVKQGFQLALQIANLGFVLTIIVIGFTTILRLEKYKTKDLLWKLIVAAVLVNFSFAITGIILDFANVLGRSFESAITAGGAIDLSTKLASSLDISQMAGLVQIGSGPASLAAIGINTIASMLSIFSGLALVILFDVMAVIVFYVVAFLMLLRNIWLMILLVVMPVVWVLWIFPNLRSHWDDWWKKFIAWTFFYPAVMIFLHLALNFSDSVIPDSNISGRIAALSGLVQVDSVAILAMLAFFAKAGILIGSLMVAQQMGISAAGAGIAAAGAVKGWAMSKAGLTKENLARLRRGESLEGGVGFGARALGKGATLGMGAKIASKIPFVNKMSWKGAAEATKGWVPSAVTAALYQRAEAPKQGAEQKQTEIEKANLSDDALMAKASSGFLPEQEAAAFANVLAKRGLFDKFKDRYASQYQRLIDAARNTGYTKHVLENKPTVAGELTTMEKLIEKVRGTSMEGTITPGNWKEKAVEHAMRSSFRPSQADQLKPAEIKQVGKYFGKGILERLARVGSLEQLKSLESVAAELRKTEPNHPVVQFVDNNFSMKRKGGGQGGTRPQAPQPGPDAPPGYTTTPGGIITPEPFEKKP